ncbi:MAG: hypothetical protein JW860_12150, partial [Sedimentisphaerales bacterium]|nr:hypothetical protein [Sedimentisphaerales bacterium]
SPGGNNSLRVLVDSMEVFSSSCPNGAEKVIIEVPLSAGQQSLQIENTGQDWFLIGYYEFVPEDASVLDSVGLSNNERAFVWIYDRGSQYGYTDHGTFSSEEVIVKGLDDGSYLVRVYATRGSGGVIDYGMADSVAGELTYTLPDFSKDIAVKVTSSCIVDIGDFQEFQSFWLLPGPNLSGTDIVNLSDFSVLAGYWLNDCPGDWPF